MSDGFGCSLRTLRETSEHTLHGRIAEQARRTPDAPAVSGVDGQLTYAELDGRANQVAHRLLAVGAGPDRPVGLLGERSAALIVGMLGILKAGSAYLPLEPGDPHHRHAALLGQAGAVAVVAAGESEPEGEWPVVRLDDQTNATQPPMVSGEALCYVLFTSGSSGAPKGVPVEHRQYLNYLTGLADHIEPGWSWASLSTFAADLGSTNVFAALTTGGHLHLLPRNEATDSAALARYLAAHEVDAMKVVPGHLAALAGPDGEWLGRILPRRLLICAGEPLRWDLVDRIRAVRPDLAVQNHYGPTETTVSMLAYHVGPNRPDSATVPIGMPFRGTGVRVLDEAGAPSATGELRVHGDRLARGYLGAPGLTARRFVPTARGAREYRTGDLVRRLASGELEFLGRVDDQVKISGYRVEPGEVSAVLASHPSVGQVAVQVREDRPGRRQLVGYVTKSTVDAVVDVVALRRFLAERLPAHLVPSAIVPLDVLPLTSNGKLDRGALPAPATGGPVAGAPASDVEGVVLATWRETLGVDRVGPHDNFFDIGGTSLLLIELRARLQRALGREVRTVTLFRNPTVRLFVRQLDATPVADAGRMVRHTYAERSRRRAAAREEVT